MAGDLESPFWNGHDFLLFLSGLEFSFDLSVGFEYVVKLKRGFPFVHLVDLFKVSLDHSQLWAYEIFWWQA